MVQYFDDDEDRCVTDLLGSREVNQAKSINLTNAITEVLDERGLRWDQVISILMDNCAVMRGVKEGVEAKARRLNTSLLDISGDTVHMASNAAKKLFESFDSFFSVSSLASNIYYDIEDSPKVKDLFGEIQSLLYGKKLSLIRPIPTRFLQLKVVADRLIQLWDALLLYYSAFLADTEQKKKDIQKTVFAKFENLTEDDKTKIQEILKGQQKQSKTDANKDRKIKILNSLFDNTTKARVMIQLFRGLLRKFESFVKSFQSAKPMVHLLHVEMFTMIKKFYCCFLKPEKIPMFSAQDLQKLDFSAEENQLQNRQMCVGEFCLPEIMPCLRDKKGHPWLPKFYSCLREGYMGAAKSLKKLPLNNITLSQMAYLDPGNQRSTECIDALNALAQQLPNVIDEDSKGKLDSEVRQYNIDQEVTLIDADSEDEGFRVDRDWWAVIFKMKKSGVVKYPLLKKLVSALLSIFAGPIVEGSFNIMGDIIEEDRTRLTTYNYEAIAMVKTYLDSRNLKVSTMEISKDMKACVSNSWGTYSKYLASSRSTEKSSAKPHSIETSSIASEQNCPASNSTTPLNPEAPNTASIQKCMKRKQASLAGFFSKRPKP